MWAVVFPSTAVQNWRIWCLLLILSSIAKKLQLAILLGAGRGRCCTGKEHSALPVRLNDYTWMGNGLNQSVILAEIYLKMFSCIILLTVQNFCLTVISFLSYFSFLCLRLSCHFCRVGCTETFLVKSAICFVHGCGVLI